MTAAPSFNSRQWLFLSLLEAFGAPLPIDAAQILCPLKPSELLELLRRAEGQGWIKATEPGLLALGYGLPPAALKKLKKINTPQRINELLESLNANKLFDLIDQQGLDNLFLRANSEKVGLETAWRQSNRAIQAGDRETALKILAGLIKRLRGRSFNREEAPFFITCALTFSNLCFTLGRDFTGAESELKQAREVAVTYDDRRSQALIRLHLGRLYYFSDRRDLALVALSQGLDEVKELGDDDIHAQSAEFLGLYYFMQGQYHNALEHLEHLEDHVISNEEAYTAYPLSPILLPYSSAYLGRFNKAVGYLESKLHLAEARSDRSLAAMLQAILGTLLLQMHKNDEGLSLLREAEKRANDTGNAFARFLSVGGLSYYHFNMGEMEKAYELLKEAYRGAETSGIVRQYASPFILEMLVEFWRRGFDTISGFNVEVMMNRILEGANIHLKGVVLRLRALEKKERGADLNEVLSDLVSSEESLKISGDMVQLSKTRLEIVRLNELHGNMDKARSLARKVWRELAEYAKEYYPPELEYLLVGWNDKEQAGNLQGIFFKRYLEATNALFPEKPQQEILSRVVGITNGLFRTERGGLFWFKGKKKQPYLLAANNLAESQIGRPDFESKLAFIRKSFQTNQPFTFKYGGTERGSSYIPKAAICLPININGEVRGVLYHDSCYLDNDFDFLDLSLMREIAHHMSALIGRVLEFNQIKKERDLLVFERNLREQNNDRDEIKGECPRMIELLERVDRVAGADSTVLITGATGTGKELLARRIHRMSSRKDGPFVVIDSTSIPKELVESELFGHETGAFTGADRQKIGRIEMADKGVVFFDEIGELPLFAQSKLLRAFQEKTFVRLGGTRNISIDFRLIAATNRDLSQEAAAGRFRKDLYYRLNVVPVELPPLRERGSDMLLLAEHFLNQYKMKYDRSDLFLSERDKEALLQYGWPGNVRELQNVIERAVILSRHQRFELNLSAGPASPPGHPFKENPTMDELQRQYIQYVLRQTGGKIGGPQGAANILGMKRTTLNKRMEKLGIRRT
ncbi:MAG: sigma 54-interacting transcriptional regulator [Thermodesulfobacteriota bacterium]